jgi:penicillin-binding protein 2B
MKKQATQVEFKYIYFILLVFLFVIISIRAVYISSSKKVDGVDIKAFAENRNTKKTVISANRGSILDANGEKLARNVTSYTVIAFLDPSRTTKKNNPQHVVEKDRTAEELAPLINMSKETILNLLNKKLYQVELGPGGRDITELTKQNIEALDLPGIGFIKGSKRDYPNSKFASYIIGYTKKNDDGTIYGELGIEKFYNDQLKGIDGYKEYQRDRQGYQIPDTPYMEIPAQSGMDIYLTIDSNIQIFLENAMEKLVEERSPDWALLTVVDAKSGAIVGSATSPNFDPNKRDLKTYINPLTSYTYEPGSTMKIFSFMTAIEHGVFKGEEKFKSGTIKVADATLKDANGVGWGNITFDQAFTHSSNVGATLLGQKVGVTKLKNYYNQLGFGKKTGIELSGELSGIVNFRYEVELANATFGQGITVTPIQMLQAMTAVTNNGVMLKPYIIDKIVNPNNNEIVYDNERTELGVVAKPETITKIKDLMDQTVNGEGPNITGRHFKTDALTVIGKTGTAQVVGKDGKYKTGKYDYVRSFIGAFPKEQPEYIVYIVAHQLKGNNSNLGTIVKEIVENISKNKYLSDDVDPGIKDNQHIIDNYINKELTQSVSILNEQTNNLIILGDGNYIIDQYPKTNTKIYKDSKVFLLTNSETIKMPNIIGWPSSEVANLCKIIGIKHQFNNYGYVTKSSFEKDELINKEKTLIIDLMPK